MCGIDRKCVHTCSCVYVCYTALLSISKISKFRTQENIDKYHSQSTDLLKNPKSTESASTSSSTSTPTPTPTSNRPVRNRRQSTMLKDSVVEETLGDRDELTVRLKSTFYETIDIVLVEMTNRFVKDDAILTAIDTAEEMDLVKLQPLTELGIELPSEIELKIAKEYIGEIRAKNQQLNDLKGPKDKKNQDRGTDRAV